MPVDTIAVPIVETTYGNDSYRSMVFPDDDRWLWFVVLVSAAPSVDTHWGRVLGCGDTPDGNKARKAARDLIARHHRQCAPRG